MQTIALVLALSLLFPQTLVRQRGPNDCMVAALAMLLERRYDEVDRARKATGILVIEDGITGPQAEAIARVLRSKVERWDLSQDMIPQDPTIVVVEFRGGTVHAVYVEKGDVYDPLRQDPEPFVVARMEWKRILYGLRVPR